MNTRCTRRKFVRNAALGGIGWTILSDVRSVRGAPANERLNLAIIGCGGRGRAFAQLSGCCAQGSNPDVNVAFLCDVNEQRAAGAFRDFPKAKKGHDYRVMFDKFNKEIDAVIVATGDYGHTPASAAAIRAGKPVYCEKPLTVAVKEARMLAHLAAKHKIITQMGNQGGYSVQAVNMVWGGLIGQVREVYSWMESRGPGRRPLPSGGHEIPRTLHWNLWLGPAPYRDYHPGWIGYNGWREFGTSGLGNRGSHSMAAVFKGLKIGELWPKDGATGDAYVKGRPLIKVSGEPSDLCLYSYPVWEKIKWEVPARADMPPVTVHWYMGEAKTFYEAQGLREKIEDMLGRKTRWGAQDAESPWGDFLGNLMLGEKGKILTGGNAGLCDDKESAPKGYREQFADVKPPNMLPSPLGSPGLGGFYAAIKGGPAPMSCFDGFSGPYIEFQMLGHVSTMFPGETLEFDPVSCSIVNNSLADRALRRPYREGWGMEEAM